jgi:acetyl esterase/lipase
MATDAAKAVKWVTEHIADYGGDPQQIFVAGHSAGGHLAALISTDGQYFKKQNIPNPIKGAILIDAAGLDMYWYMKEVDYGPQDSYLSIFTKEPETWKDASPIYHIRKGMPPMLILSGRKSYPTLISSNDRFIAALQKHGIQPTVILQQKKKHIPMITQFFNVYNPRYKDILQFMKANTQR